MFCRLLACQSTHRSGSRGPNLQFEKKLGFTPAEIRAQCTGAAFDGEDFSLKCPEAIAKRMVEAATGGLASPTEVQNLKKKKKEKNLLQEGPLKGDRVLGGYAAQ